MRQRSSDTVLAMAVIAAGFAFASPAAAHADPDTDFANKLHAFGIYGPRDYNAWIGKITCKRLNDGLDVDAYKSAQFVTVNLPRRSTTAEAWQFLGAAIDTYCPDQVAVLERAAEHGTSS
jgi:hypothetical protein